MELENTSKILYRGPTGSGKTSRLKEHYKKLMTQGVNTNHILVLVRNRRKVLEWKKHLEFPSMSKQRILSYFGFIQGEVKKYWPLIQNKVPGIELHRLEPVFMTIETSQFIMGKMLEGYRKEGKLMELHTTHDRASIELTHNIAKAAMAKRDPEGIGELLYHTHGNRENLHPLLYQEVQALMNRYRRDCLSKGIFDYGITIELYENYLRKDLFYRNRLLEQNQHVIVDDVEEAVPSEIDLIYDLVEQAATAALSFNRDGEMTRAFGACPELVGEKLEPLCQVRELNAYYLSSPDLHQFGKKLALHIQGNDTRGISCKPKIEYIEKELRSEMIKTIGEKILDLVQEGIPREEIAVISPTTDNVLAHSLQNLLKKEGLSLHHLTGNKRMTDEIYGKALLVIACFCHPQWELYPSPEDITTTLSMILQLDRIRSSLLAREATKKKPFQLPSFAEIPVALQRRIGKPTIKKYEFLRIWIANYQQGKELPIDSFFQKFFIEILVFMKDTEKHLALCRQWMDSASSFLSVVQYYEAYAQNGNAYFVEMISRGIKAAETLEEIEIKQFTQEIILTTPYDYLSRGYQRRVHLWVDALSEEWYPRDEKELTNPHVFSPVWENHRPWREEDSEAYRYRKLGITVQRLLNRCGERLIVAQSLYNRNGVEQEGVLYSKILEIHKN